MELQQIVLNSDSVGLILQDEKVLKTLTQEQVKPLPGSQNGFKERQDKFVKVGSRHNPLKISHFYVTDYEEQDSVCCFALGRSHFGSLRFEFPCVYVQPLDRSGPRRPHSRFPSPSKIQFQGCCHHCLHIWNVGYSKGRGIDASEHPLSDSLLQGYPLLGSKRSNAVFASSLAYLRACSGLLYIQSRMPCCVLWSEDLEE